MVIIGILVVLLAIALGIAVLYGTSTLDDVEIDAWDTVAVTVSPLVLVIVGMVAMFLFFVGLAMIRSALARKQRLRRERKEQERQAKERQAAHEQQLADQREQERLAHEQRERDYEQQLHDQKLSTQAARERAAVAEQEAGTRPVETTGGAGASDAPAAPTQGGTTAPPPRPSWTGDSASGPAGADQRATDTQKIDPAQIGPRHRDGRA